MKKNVGSVDRLFRALGGIAMLVGSVFGPWSLVLRVAVFATMGVYLLWTSVAGTCLGYRLMGRSTCPIELQR